jgi:hypothetical protein
MICCCKINSDRRGISHEWKYNIHRTYTVLSSQTKPDIPVLLLLMILLPRPLKLGENSSDNMAQIKHKPENDGESSTSLVVMFQLSYFDIKRLYFMKCREINNKRDRRNVGIWNLSDASI